MDSYINQAYSIAKTTGDDECTSRVLEQLGYITGLKGDMKKSNDYLREALDVLDKLSDKKEGNRLEIDKNRFFALLNFGETEHRLGRFDKGLMSRLEALKIAESHNNQVWMGYAHYEIGEMYHLTGHNLLARHHMLQALALFEKNNARKDAEAVMTFLNDGGYEIENTV